MSVSASSSRARRVMEAAIPRRLLVKNTSTTANQAENQESSGSVSMSSPNPPTYGDVPSVNPPSYVDNETVPSYYHHRRDRLLTSRPMMADSESDSEALGEYSLRSLDITPPDNRIWLEHGWDWETQLDDCLNANLSYLRQVLVYLRANWDTPINPDIEDISRRARITYRNLTREITHFYAEWQDRELGQIDAKYQMFQHQQHSLWRRNLEFLSTQHQKVLTRYKIKHARISRTNALDEAIYKINLQRQSIFIRSTGFEQC